MRLLLASLSAALLVTAAPDGPGHHHQHGAHHGEHHAPHHAEHGVVSLGAHQVGGVVQVASVPVHHNVHVVQPVHSLSGHFAVQSDPHHAAHTVHAEHHGPHHAQPHHAEHHGPHH